MLENKPNPDTETDPMWLFDISDIHKSRPVSLLNPPKNVYRAHLLLPSALPGSVQISSFCHHSPASLRLCSVLPPQSFPETLTPHRSPFFTISSIYLFPCHLIMGPLCYQGKSQLAGCSGRPPLPAVMHLDPFIITQHMYSLLRQ